jgi:cytidine deaminase
MAEFSITIKGLSVTKSDLSESDTELLARAEQATLNAYAPYSQFNVGAALRLETDEIIIGSNQENVAYPSGLCAERVALFAASTLHPRMVVKTMAITARTTKFELTDPLAPCGGCRQVIMEYQRKQQQPIRMLLAGKGDTVWIFEDASMLLPFGFEADYLKGD